MVMTSLNEGLTKARGLSNRESFSYKATKGISVHPSGWSVCYLRQAFSRMGSGSHYPMGIGRLD